MDMMQNESTNPPAEGGLTWAGLITEVRPKVAQISDGLNGAARDPPTMQDLLALQDPAASGHERTSGVFRVRKLLQIFSRLSARRLMDCCRRSFLFGLGFFDDNNFLVSLKCFLTDPCYLN